LPGGRLHRRRAHRWRLGTRSLVGLLLLAALVVGAGCGGGGDHDGGGGVSLTELKGYLPAAGKLGLKQQQEREWDNATDLLVQGLVIPAATKPSKLGAAIEDAGFQGAVGSDLADSRPELHVRVAVARFDSEAGAVEARDLLHEQDLKQPCSAACVVSPREYELDEIPNSAAVHHVPLRGKLPPGVSKVEAHHAEFVIGAQLYVVQADGRPSEAFSTRFDKLMRTVYAAVSSN
jgi:hypothetical protein